MHTCVMSTTLYTILGMVHLILILTALLAAGVPGAAAQPSPSNATLRDEIDGLNAAMVATFKRDPVSVATFYTDEALIVGGGRRSQGRAAVIEYWKGAAMFAEWTLETLQTGGSVEAPWQYSRSVVVSRSGSTMETFFLGLLRRHPSGDLKMHVDAYSRERKVVGPAEAARITDTWLRATRGDVNALKVIADDPFAIFASTSRPPEGVQQGNAAIVEAVANAVDERYVFPDVAPKIAGHIRERARQGAYDKLTGGELADALTHDLREQNGDRHLSVQYQPGQPAAPGGADLVRQTPGASAASAEMMRRRNYFLNRAERLDGNIGYLDVRRFFGQTDEARDAVAGAMAFLARTDAIIIDVRYVPGGDVRMVDLLASYFFDKVVPTLATYFRPRNETIQRSTLESVPGRRRPDIPVYVLISRDTGSAAEDFAFLLRQTGRATLVGGRTAGAGHSNVIVGIGGGYSVSVSVGRTYDPKTNEGWEGTGVQPHVRAAADDALDTAHRLAVSALIDKAKDSASQRELSWTRDMLDARRTPVAVEAKTLQSYAGQYGVRHVTLDHGRLWYQRAADAERIPLLALSATEFAMGEGQRVQFDAKDVGVELRVLTADGTHVAYARQRQEPRDWQAWLDERAAQFSGAVLIARADTEEIAAAYGLADRRANIRNTVDTRFNLGSINKTFTAIAIAQLIQRGRLSVDDTLGKHLPDYPNREAAAMITIRQLLSHRSGVATFMQADFGDAASVAAMTRVVGSAPQKFEPGARQEYSNGGYVVLGRVVEVVSGKSYNDYISENIYKPAGMTDTGFVDSNSAEGMAGSKAGSGSRVALGYFAADPQGRPVVGGQGGAAGFNPPGTGNPAGGGYSTVRDLFKFSRALRNGRLLDTRMTDYVLNGTFSGQAGSTFGFALREQIAGARRFIGNGGGAPGVNAEFRFEPAGDYTAVVLSNASPPAATQLLARIMERLALGAMSQKPQ